ncbi:hypothetical protein LJR225_005224 [Phenylobacterium sp. LjRoot225]|uniref:hypothetical protein n=1 Tax=Phenylobacterium sp. LjRoot225 TaxID=3342285 RepID=UPI003ECC3FC9
MRSAQQLDLLTLDLHSPAMAADPVAFIEAAWAHHASPARSEQGLVVTEYQTMKDLMSMDGPGA